MLVNLFVKFLKLFFSIFPKSEVCINIIIIFSNQNLIFYRNFIIFVHSPGDTVGFFFKIAHGLSATIALISLNHVYTWFSNLCFNTLSTIFPSLNTICLYQLVTIIVVLYANFYIYRLIENPHKKKPYKVVKTYITQLQFILFFFKIHKIFYIIH